MTTRTPDRSPLAHPVTLTFLGLLVLNDHYLKLHHASSLTGKLSDTACMVVAPLFVYVCLQLAARSCLARPPPPAEVLTLSILLVAGSFTSMQLTDWGDAAYRVGLGIAQWPLLALREVLWGAGLPEIRAVARTPDPTDLFCLPFLGFNYWIVARDPE